MFVFCHLGGHTLVKDVNSDLSVEHLLNLLKIPSDSFYILHNGHKVGDDYPLENGNTYHFVPRILGGKGGFGSMLRAIGAQIEKTTSREACRDLSGRRMRDVNNEKKLKEWLSKESDREREREERRKERLARRLAGSKHNFDDPEYHKERSKVQEDLDDALQKGLKRASDKNGAASSSTKPGLSKKMKSSNKEWLGMDIDSDDLDSDSDNEANPGSPNITEMKSEISIKDEITEDASIASSTGEKSTDEKTPPPDIKLIYGHDIHCNKPHMENSTTAGDEVEGNEVVVSDEEPVDLDMVDSVDELISLGLVRLKNALMARGLKCGGTLEERAERLFSVKSLTPDQIPSSLIAKSKGVGKKSK